MFAYILFLFFAIFGFHEYMYTCLDQPSTHDLLKQIYIDVKKTSGMVWLAPTSNIKNYFNAENPEADLLLTDVVARLLPPIDVMGLNHTIASLLTNFPEFGKIGWISGGPEYKNITTRFSPELARLMVLFSLVLPSTVLFYNNEENLIKNQSHYQSDGKNATLICFLFFPVLFGR